MAIHAQANCKLTTKPAKTSLLGGHFIYKTTPSLSGKTLQSANVVQTIEKNGIDVTDDPTQWGYNVNIGSSGIKLRNNETTLSEWTNSGLIFYKPNTNIIAASVSSTGLNIIKGTITLGNNFSVTSDGILTASGANIAGDITATSLTIDNNGDIYNGVAAINISGYDIEITSDSTGVIDTTNTIYLYPILYHNGIKVEEYELTTDVTVDPSKSYYVRTGSAGDYTYTWVVDPDPYENPRENLYYEKRIDYSHFIWYQDDIEPGTEGDVYNKGRYLATYGHNYRVIYDFDDGAVSEGTQIQTRTIDPSKYITKINDYGITIHPEIWENESSYIQLTGSGMELFNSSGNSIAQYGSTARIGISNSSRFLMNSNSLQAYDNNNNKYFEVSSSSLVWGNNTAATAADLANKADASDVEDAAKTATNYISYIDSTNGIRIYDGQSENENINFAQVNSNGLQIYQDGAEEDNKIAEFGASGIQIGRNNSEKIILTSNDFTAYNSDSIPFFNIDYDGGLINVDTYISFGKGSTVDVDEYIRHNKTSEIASSTTKVPSNAANNTTIRSDMVLILFTYITSAVSSNQLYISNTIKEQNGLKIVSYSQLTYKNKTAVRLWLGVSSKFSFRKGTAFSTSKSITLATKRQSNDSEVENVKFILDISYDPQDDDNITHTLKTTASGEVSVSNILVVEPSVTFTKSYAYNSPIQTDAPSLTFGYRDVDEEERGGFSSTFGESLTAGSEAQFIIGKYNNNQLDTLFEIGNGTSNLPSNALIVNENGNVSIAGTLTQSSDRRLKEHISYLDKDAINFVQKLKPAYFKKDKQPHVGFYAQDVEENDSWHCMIGEMNGFKTLGYTEIIAPLVAYCQHLEGRIKQLEEK